MNEDYDDIKSLKEKECASSEDWAADYDAHNAEIKEKESQQNTKQKNISCLIIGGFAFMMGLVIMALFTTFNSQTALTSTPQSILMVLTPTSAPISPSGTDSPIAPTTAKTNSQSSLANPDFGETLTTDTFWSEDVFLAGDLTVPNGIRLTIRPGVTVRFAANQDDYKTGKWEDKAELHIFGTLVVEGTESQPVKFVSADDDPQPGDWGGILIRKNSSGSIISGCIINSAQNGVRFHMDYEGEGKLTGIVQNCIINNNHIGIRLQGIPRYDTDGGLVTISSIIRNNTIENNVEAGIHMLMGSGYGTNENSALIENNVIAQNNTGIYLNNRTWWLGHSRANQRIINNVIQDNIEYGIYLQAVGSSDASGSDTVVRPEIRENVLDNNPHNIFLFLDPKGGDGTQLLHPIISCNTFQNGSSGITIQDTETGGELLPEITYNIFRGFEQEQFAINNLTNRSIEAQKNLWQSKQHQDVTANVSGDVISDNPLSTSLSPVLCPTLEQ